MAEKFDPKAVLALEIADCDIGPTTVGGYLGELLVAMLKEGDGFSGKRPFGNSDWMWQLMEPLVRADIITGSYDEDEGTIEDIDFEAGERVLVECVRFLLPKPKHKRARRNV